MLLLFFQGAGAGPLHRGAHLVVSDAVETAVTVGDGLVTDLAVGDALVTSLAVGDSLLET